MTKFSFPLHVLTLTTLALPLSIVGCDSLVTKKEQKPQEKKTEIIDADAVPEKKVKIGKNVYMEVFPGDKRRVTISAYVCRREDQLEQLLCRKRTKEHEAILAADIDARVVHAALIAAKAKPGSPVQYRPYKGATGTTIKIFLQYKDDKGKQVTIPAQQWIYNIRTKKDMKYDWVFAGSKLFPPAQPGDEPYYAANEGDVICVANFDTAMLDLPVESSKDNEGLIYEANTKRIPPLETPVLVILQPILDANQEAEKKQQDK